MPLSASSVHDSSKLLQSLQFLVLRFNGTFPRLPGLILDLYARWSSNFGLSAQHAKAWTPARLFTNMDWHFRALDGLLQ
jgi:hypothetical protein